LQLLVEPDAIQVELACQRTGIKPMTGFMPVALQNPSLACALHASALDELVPRWIERTVSLRCVDTAETAELKSFPPVDP
jgi:hypothetical protein